MAREVIKRQFTAIYQKRGRWFLAWVEEIPGVNTQGRTLKETQENLKEALQMVIESNRKLARSRYDFKREPVSISIPA